MPRGPLGWRFRDVEVFIKNRGFRLNHTNGSHYYYVGSVEKVLRQVCAPFHGARAIKPRTLLSIIRQSGIPKNEWFEKKK